MVPITAAPYAEASALELRNTSTNRITHTNRNMFAAGTKIWPCASAEVCMHAHARQQVELHGFARQRERARDHRLRGDDRRGRGQQHQQRQRAPAAPAHRKDWRSRVRRLDQQRALAEVVEHQRRPHQDQPAETHRLAAEMPHVGVQRFAARHREEHRAEDRERRAPGDAPNKLRPYSGFTAEQHAAARARSTRRRAPASVRNQSTMIGPNMRPTRSVPRRWIANRTTMTPSVTGNTARGEIRSRASPGLRPRSARRSRA